MQRFSNRITHQQALSNETTEFLQVLIRSFEIAGQGYKGKILPLREVVVACQASQTLVQIQQEIWSPCQLTIFNKNFFTGHQIFLRHVVHIVIRLGLTA